jgi:hypothetical protein
MRRAFGWLTVMLAGCFSPSAPTGAACAAPGVTERCPAGLLCVAHDGVETCELTGADAGGADATDAADADADRDHDGLRDTIDNCPDIANAKQADEDADQVGDVCDPCPPLQDNEDNDGDGVGDACDPNPATPGDKLVAFVGFTDVLPPAWTTSGTFMLNNGDGVLIAGDSASSLLTMASPPAARIEVRAALVVELITASGLNLGSVNLIDRLQPNTDNSVACQLAGLANGTQEQLRLFDANAAMVIVDAPHAFAPGEATELRLRRNATSYACRVSGLAATEVAGTAAFSPASPRIGLRVRGAGARFRWLMLVTSP